MVKFVGAAKLVELPRAFKGEFIGNCCALLPIGINKPKLVIAAKAL